VLHSFNNPSLNAGTITQRSDHYLAFAVENLQPILGKVSERKNPSPEDILHFAQKRGPGNIKLKRWYFFENNPEDIFNKPNNSVFIGAVRKRPYKKQIFSSGEITVSLQE